MSEPIEIITRQTMGTYTARAKGYKGTASRSEGARQAAEALLRKLGLAVGALEKGSNKGLAYGCDRFVHSGEQGTNTSEQAHCPSCSICHTADETCNQARERVAHACGGAA